MVRGPADSITWPTALGSTIPPKLSPSRMMLVRRPVRSMDCPASVKPVGQMGAMQNPNPIAISHSTVLELEKSMPRISMTRLPSRAARIICFGLKRMAAGMEIYRPMVNASQNMEFR